MKKFFQALFWGFLLLAVTGTAFAQGGIKKKRVRPYLYGRVVINNFSTSAGLAPVVFDHWLHRTVATCRLCHIDIGFAMEANSTEIRAVDNIRGFYCGACHNAKATYKGKKVFQACSKESSGTAIQRCQRCHNNGETPAVEDKFYSLSAKLPRSRSGNGIDWEKAESEHLINPVDYLEGISIKGPKLASIDDLELTAKVEGMPDIIFSHAKHTVWNGCEVCHPEIFLGVKKGATLYSMIDLFQGKYCGVCHDKVAFPQTDCQRCHSKPVM